MSHIPRDPVLHKLNEKLEDKLVEAKIPVNKPLQKFLYFGDIEVDSDGNLCLHGIVDRRTKFNSSKLSETTSKSDIHSFYTDNSKRLKVLDNISTLRKNTSEGNAVVGKKNLELQSQQFMSEKERDLERKEAANRLKEVQNNIHQLNDQFLEKRVSVTGSSFDRPGRSFAATKTDMPQFTSGNSSEPAIILSNAEVGRLKSQTGHVQEPTRRIRSTKGNQKELNIARKNAETLKQRSFYLQDEDWNSDAEHPKERSFALNQKRVLVSLYQQKLREINDADAFTEFKATSVANAEAVIFIWLTLVNEVNYHILSTVWPKKQQSPRFCRTFCCGLCEKVVAEVYEELTGLVTYSMDQDHFCQDEDVKRHLLKLMANRLTKRSQRKGRYQSEVLEIKAELLRYEVWLSKVLNVVDQFGDRKFRCLKLLLVTLESINLFHQPGVENLSLLLFRHAKSFTNCETNDDGSTILDDTTLAKLHETLNDLCLENIHIKDQELWQEVEDIAIKVGLFNSTIRVSKANPKGQEEGEGDDEGDDEDEDEEEQEQEEIEEKEGCNNSGHAHITSTRALNKESLLKRFTKSIYQCFTSSMKNYMLNYREKERPTIGNLYSIALTLEEFKIRVAYLSGAIVNHATSMTSEDQSKIENIIRTVGTDRCEEDNSSGDFDSLDPSTREIASLDQTHKESFVSLEGSRLRNSQRNAAAVGLDFIEQESIHSQDGDVIMEPLDGNQMAETIRVRSIKRSMGFSDSDIKSPVKEQQSVIMASLKRCKELLTDKLELNEGADTAVGEKEFLFFQGKLPSQLLEKCLPQLTLDATWMKNSNGFKLLLVAMLRFGDNSQYPLCYGLSNESESTALWLKFISLLAHYNQELINRFGGKIMIMSDTAKGLLKAIELSRTLGLIPRVVHKVCSQHFKLNLFRYSNNLKLQETLSTLSALCGMIFSKNPQTIDQAVKMIDSQFIETHKSKRNSTYQTIVDPKLRKRLSFDGAPDELSNYDMYTSNGVETFNFRILPYRKAKTSTLAFNLLNLQNESMFKVFENYRVPMTKAGKSKDPQLTLYSLVMFNQNLRIQEELKVENLQHDHSDSVKIFKVIPSIKRPEHNSVLFEKTKISVLKDLGRIHSTYLRRKIGYIMFRRVFIEEMLKADAIVVQNRSGYIESCSHCSNTAFDVGVCAHGLAVIIQATGGISYATKKTKDNFSELLDLHHVKRIFDSKSQTQISHLFNFQDYCLKNIEIDQELIVNLKAEQNIPNPVVFNETFHAKQKQLQYLIDNIKRNRYNPESTSCVDYYPLFESIVSHQEQIHSHIDKRKPGRPKGSTNKRKRNAMGLAFKKKRKKPENN